jgi:6-pyruvoyl-tetrahydropterin synthase related domain
MVSRWRNEVRVKVSPESSGESSRTASLIASDILILGTAAILLALPMIIYGPMATGHDTFEHVNYCHHFSEQFWGGEWYPRWLLNMNHGLGSPSLFVYPPFASYIYTFLQPLGAVFHFNPFNAGEFLALVGSGVCAFLWVKTTASRTVALVSAVLYMLMPYHLAVDFYRRNALSECWALVWMPLVLYFSTQIMARKRRALLGVAIAYALLILSHFVSVLIFSLVPLAFALALSERGERIKSVLLIAAGMVLGTGLSCFYFVPALFYSKYFPVMKMLRPPSFVLADNFIQLHDRPAGTSDGGFLHGVSLSALGLIAFIAICGFVVLWRGRPDSRRKTAFWLAACVLPVFLMSHFSLWLWGLSSRHLSSLLLRAVQYPWRFNVVLCLGAVAIIALFLSELSRISRLGRNVTLGLVSLIILTWFISYGQIWVRYRTDVFVPNPKQLVDDDDGWFYSWSAPGLDEASALKASIGPQIRFLGVDGTSAVQVWKARQIEFHSNSPDGGWVMINQFYYPGWTALLAGTTQRLESKAAMPEGLLEVEVPPGNQEVRVEIPVGPVEKAGRWISIMSVLLYGILVWQIKQDYSSDHKPRVAQE